MFPPDFITLERIGYDLEIASKKRILQQLGELLASGQPGLPPDAVFDRLLERERLGSTGLGHGIALPHARMAHVRQAVGAFIRLREGVDFDAIDDRSVDLAFALLVPQEATEVHLQLLAQLAAMFGNERFCDQLRQAQSAGQLLELIQGWEAHVPAP
jgi:PTS system nitrogen regulatory IIA component